MKKFTLTKQLFAAALVVAMGFTGCQKSEMEDVGDTLRATSTSLASNEWLELSFSDNPVIVGNEVTITATKLSGAAHGTFEIKEYRVGNTPALAGTVGGDWVQVASFTNSQGSNISNGLTINYKWTPSSPRMVSYQVNLIGSQHTRTISADLEIINPCVGNDISFNLSTTRIDLIPDSDIKNIYVEYELGFCNSNVHRIVVTALILQPEAIEELLYTSRGKNALITWDQLASDPNRNFGVSFTKKIKGNGPHKMTGVWHARLYDINGVLLGEVNSPAHSSFE